MSEVLDTALTWPAEVAKGWNFVKDITHRPRVDFLVIHSNDLNDTVGSFHGTPIIAWDVRDTERRENQDAAKRLNFAKEQNG